MTPLSLSDALWLTLVVAACGALLLGDLTHWLRQRGARRAPAPVLAPVAAPVPVPAASATALPPPGRPALPRAADLLLVDDSAVARAKLRRLFEGAGYSVQLACDGVEALARLAEGRYAMMITDLEMPNLDGVSLITECLARPATSRMPILAVSGHENLRARFNECRDICGVHRKPWADDILLSHVAALIGTPAARPGIAPQGRAVAPPAIAASLS